MKLRKGDLLVVFIILFAALALFGLKHFPASAGERLLRIEHNGQVIQEIPFNNETTEKVRIPLGKDKGFATAEIKEGRVRLLPLPKDVCHLGLCSSVGWIEQSGDAIVCLPNRLILTVFGGPNNDLWDSLDGVTK